MKISDEAMAAAKARYAEMWGDGDIDRAGEQMLTDVLEAAGPVIAAQSALAERVKIVAEVRQHAERAARTIGSSRAASIAVAAIENEVADRINTLPAPDPDCCNAPNMVWDHSRDGKDYFRCHACGSGMTKARAVAP